MKNKEQTCCFTGHRIIPKKDILMIHTKLQQEIIELAEQGVTDFCVGGALGFDTIAAETVLKVREQHPQIKLILVLPCQSQEKLWGTKDILRYQKILGDSDEHLYVSEQYTKECMFLRNRRLVEMSSYCICYCNKSMGGTAYTVQYAKKNHLTIKNLAAQTQISMFETI